MTRLIYAEARPQADAPGQPYHEWRSQDGTVWTRFFRTTRGYLLRFPGLADFAVSKRGRSVCCMPVPAVSQATLEHLYSNQVRPLVMGLLGRLAFHASAVEIDDAAVAFAGDSGLGKSTLAASFAVQGTRFLTDDGLYLEACDAGYWVNPSHPSIRLWDDSREEIVGDGAETAPALDYTEKARMLGGLGLPHCAARRVLRAVFFLADEGVESVRVTRLTAAESLVAWVKNAFLLDIESRAALASHFNGVAALAERVRAYRLDFPREYEGLAEVRRVVTVFSRGED